MNRSIRSALAGLAAMVVIVPLTVVATSASWNDNEWVHGDQIGTANFDCGVDTGYAVASTGTFLSGELLGTDLNAIAALAPVALERSEAGLVEVTPSDSIDLGSDPPVSTYANPLDITVLGGIAGLDLTGLQVGLPVGSAGAVNQYAQVSGHGTAAAASGLVSDSGGVLVSADTPDDELPEPATISLDEILPAASGIADVELDVGAVASSSQLDGCAQLRSILWGDGSVTGVTRDYGIASLGLELDSDVVAGLVGTVNGSLATITTAINSLTGTTGLISGRIRTGIDVALSDLLVVQAMTGSVTISGIDLAGSLGTLLTTPLSDGIVTIDLGTGQIDVDLAALLGGPPDGLNDLPPNTELVLDSTVLNPIVVRVGDLLDTWTSQIVTVLRDEIRDANLIIDLSTVVRIAGGIDVVRVNVDAAGTIGSLLDGGLTLTVTTEVLGLVSVINAALALVGLPNVTTIVNTILGLTVSLTTSVANIITTTALGAVTTLGSVLTSAVTPLLTALDGLVAALPSVLSLMVNVQPDQPGPPVISSDQRTVGPYSVSALRIGLADALSPGGIAYVEFATSTAGPVTRP